MKPTEGRARVVIEEVRPEVDCGRYPTRRIIGDELLVTAAIFGDGHDHLGARLLYRHKTERRWRAVAMKELGNDLWSASFVVNKLGHWQFSVEGWVDHFDTWCSDLRKRLAAQPDPEKPDPLAVSQNIPLALRTGANILEKTARRASGSDAKQFTEVVASLRWMADQNAATYEYPLTEQVMALASRYPDLEFATKYAREGPVWVDRERARYSTWYELFPRSASSVPGKHGTFRDVELQLPEVAAMGFDVLYMPPIHPIGTAFRKGKNNSTIALEGDARQPVGDRCPRTKDNEGGHKAIHPELGTLADFDHLVRRRKRTLHRIGVGHRLPVFARSPLGQGSSRLVHDPARRLDSVC